GLRSHAPLYRVPRPARADAHGACLGRLRGRCIARSRPDRGIPAVAAGAALAAPPAVAPWRVLSAALARERRAGLAEPVHAVVLGHQLLARRGDPTGGARVVVQTALTYEQRAARARRLRRCLLRQRPGGHVALLARL